MNDPQSQRETEAVWPLAIVLIFWITVVGLSLLAYRPPQPLGPSVPADQFSAARAETILQTLVGDSIPHPAGSHQNSVVRNRIISLLESFGYEVEVQTGRGKVASKVKDRSPDRDEVELHNLIARRAGTGTSKPIMLVSHYDSVPFGPGASDDGVGTAALLEIARMLASEPPPKRDVVFLITDGEEFGMLGAQLFVRHHPLAKRIGVAINLESRGTTGPSCMFETSHQSRMLVPLFAGSSRKHFASSLFYEVYKRMPNDTDFSVLRKNGILGYNFAFIGDVKNYHTAADNFENADRGSLQHHGENALGLIRKLQNWNEYDQLFTAAQNASGSIQAQQKHEAVYFDVLGKWIVWWPSPWSMWLSYLAFVLFAIAAWRFQPAGGETETKPTNSLASLITHCLIHGLTVVAIFVVGYLIQYAVRQDPRMSNPWPLQPVPILSGYWFASFAIAGGFSLAFSKWLNPRSTWTAFCIIWLVLALMTSVVAAGASHLFIVPMVATSVTGLLTCWSGRRGLIACVVVAALAVGLIWLPMERLFYDAVGFKMPKVMLFRISMLSMSLLGLLSLTGNRTKFAFAISMSVLAVVSFVVAVFLNAGP